MQATHLQRIQYRQIIAQSTLCVSKENKCQLLMHLNEIQEFVLSLLGRESMICSLVKVVRSPPDSTHTSSQQQHNMRKLRISGITCSLFANWDDMFWIIVNRYSQYLAFSSIKQPGIIIQLMTVVSYVLPSLMLLLVYVH